MWCVRKSELYPTELGTLVVDLMKEYFPDIMNAEFTASMESQLDMIEEGNADWVEVLRAFYGPFAKSPEPCGAGNGKNRY